MWKFVWNDSRRFSYIPHMPQATTTLQKLSRLVLPDRACVDKSCDKHMAADNKQKVGDTLICRRTWWWEPLETWNYVWRAECRRTRWWESLESWNYVWHVDPEFDSPMAIEYRVTGCPRSSAARFGRKIGVLSHGGVVNFHTCSWILIDSHRW